MEHREPPRTVAEDLRAHPIGPETSSRPPDPTLALPAPARPTLDRGLSILAVSVVLGAIGLFGLYRAAVFAVGWLGDQPTYQVRFRSIRLVPPPPAWYRGGQEAFLDQVRRRAGMPETFPLLKLEAAKLQDMLRLNPWTEDVTRITREPLGIAVELKYHVPVAIVETSSGRKYLVDRSAVILPMEDVDWDRLGGEKTLIRINGQGLSDPLDPRPGIAWQPAPGIVELAPGNAKIASAARLAEFLETKMRHLDASAGPALRFDFINPMDPYFDPARKEVRGLFLWNAEKTYILWGKAPDEEDQEGLGAEEKWERLLEWTRKEPHRVLAPGDYWEITGRGLVHVQPRPSAAAGRRPDRPAQDTSAIRAHDSGQRP